MNLREKQMLKVSIWDLAKTHKTFKFMRRTSECIERLYGASSEVALNTETHLQALSRPTETENR